MAAQNFKLFLGCLGNGVTVCNSAVMEDGDFKMVAHISNEGEITWYVGEDYPPADALASIRACAEQERVKYETWLNGLSPAARREYQLERLPLPEFLEELRIAVIGEDYMMFTAAKEAFNLSQNERIIVELAAAFYNAGLWEMPGFEMVSGTCDTAFALILEAFRLRRAKLFYKDGEVSAEWEERK